MIRRPLLAFIIILVLVLIVGVSRRQYVRDQITAPSDENKRIVSGFPDKTEKEKNTRQFSLGAGEYINHLTGNSRDRKYLLYVPKSYQKEIATPLVLFYHGGGGGMRQASNTYGWKEKSEKEGFIVAFTNGTSGVPGQVLATWNAGSCCGYARDNNIDDITYTKMVIEDIQEHFNVREDQIFATGFSNGGMLMHRLACDAPELVSAVVAVSGTDGTSSCTPKKQIPVMHIHALDDTHVLFNGGAGEESFRDISKVTEFISVPETTNRWIKRYGLTPNSKRIFENRGAYCDRYQGSTANGSFTLCVTPDGKHSWPGAKDPSHSGAIPSKTLDGTDVAWDFFMGKF